jgi:hypothetical protein
MTDRMTVGLILPRLFVSSLALGSGASCQAQRDEPAAAVASGPIAGQLWGKPKTQAEDVSGLACAPETSGRRLCLMVDDESQGAQIVVLRNGSLTAGDFVELISDTHDGKRVELDAEAVAYGDGAFYVIGSHGRARHEADSKEEAKNEAKARASRRTFRLRFPPDSVDTQGRLAPGAKPEVKRSERLIDLILAEAALKSAFDQPLGADGLTIEGLAVSSGSLKVGFRAPIVDDKALLLSVPLSSVFDNQPVKGQVRYLALGRDTTGAARGIRDLAAQDDGFVGIAGPVQDPPKSRAIRRGDYALFFWHPGEPIKCQALDAYQRTEAAREPASLGTWAKPQEKPLKPEGLTLLDSGAADIRALVTFDGATGGSPTLINLRPSVAPTCETS